MSGQHNVNGQFVWLRGVAPGRQLFVRFERRFDWHGTTGPFPLRLFADTRYRLRVNGEFAGAGPARFVTQHPEFDTYDLAPLLRSGTNRLEVEVNFFGSSSFQSMPDGKPGFWAEGGADGVDLATPGDWTAVLLRAWRRNTPLFSFAQNPVETCDTRLLEHGKPAEIEVCHGEAAPWGLPEPYSGAPLQFDRQDPVKILLAGRLQNTERRFGFMVHNGEDCSAPCGHAPARPWIGFATWIHARVAAKVPASCSWNDLFLNGQCVAVKENARFCTHGCCDLDLRQGWNLLAGKVCVLSQYWAYCLGIPKDADLSLHARRDTGCPEVFAVSPMVRDKNLLALPSPDATEAPAGWRAETGSPEDLTPARMMAWDAVETGAIRDLDFSRWSEVACIEGREATWCVRFAGEFHGYVVLDVEAPAGTILDVGFDDWSSPSGTLAYYHTSPFVDTAERFFLRGGRQKVELFNPRGGKFLQITMRAPEGPAPLALHKLDVRLRRTTHRDLTLFTCGEGTLDWMWPVTMRTLLCSSDEAYSDCPWRERGTYIGDAYVGLHLDYILHADPRTARRCLRQFAQAALPDGQLACCAPSWLRKPHEDYTLIWILALHDHWEITGDLETVRELWETLEGIWASPSWEAGSSGLWSLHGGRQFIDWGVPETEREGDANATINLFRLGALRASAALASAIGAPARASDFLREAERVEQSLFDILWDSARGCLRASAGSGTGALHANVLALRFEAGPLKARARILEYLEPAVRGNLGLALRGKQASGHLELYFLHYLLPALAAHERPDLAEHVLSTHYGHIRALGDDTLPETLWSLASGGGSRCHSWSGAGAIYAARHILGVRPDAAGDPDRLVCAPLVHSIKRASGRIAHRKGWIEVQWDDAGTLPRVRAPQGVHVRLLPVNRTGKLPHADAAC